MPFHVQISRLKLLVPGQRAEQEEHDERTQPNDETATGAPFSGSDADRLQALIDRIPLPPIDINQCRLIACGDRVTTKWKGGKYQYDAEVNRITPEGLVLVSYPPPAQDEPQRRCTSRTFGHVRRLPSEVLSSNIKASRQKKELENGRVLVDRPALEARLLNKTSPPPSPNKNDFTDQTTPTSPTRAAAAQKLHEAHSKTSQQAVARLLEW